MTPDAESTWQALMQAHRQASASDGLSRFRLFNRAADDLARVLDETAGRVAFDLGRAQSPTLRPTCVHCQTSGLEHFFTFTTTGAVLCQACYAVRARSDAGGSDRDPTS